MLSKRLTDAPDNLQQYPGTYRAHEIYNAAACFSVLSHAPETRQQLYVDHPTSLKLSWILYPYLEIPNMFCIDA